MSPFDDDNFQVNESDWGDPGFQTGEEDGNSIDVTSTDYYTDMYSLMKAVKYNMKQYRKQEAAIQISKGDINWGLGYIMQRMVFPAITVFPQEKIFGPRRGGGVSIVEYRLSVDIYSGKYVHVSDSKKWLLKAIEDVRTCLKGAITMPDEHGKKHCFDCKVIGVDIAEDPKKRGYKFQSTGSITIACFAYHKMSTNRSKQSVFAERSTEKFYSDIITEVKGAYSGPPYIASWLDYVGQPVIKSPTVFILPIDEQVDDDYYAANRDLIIRPIVFTVATKAIPTLAVIKSSLNVADNIVVATENRYQIKGYAMNCIINSISYDHAKLDSGFEFYSIVAVTYNCYQEYERILR